MTIFNPIKELSHFSIASFGGAEPVGFQLGEEGSDSRRVREGHTPFCHWCLD